MGAQDRLAAFALSLPGAWEDFPWGERVAKVGKKVFVFLGKPGEGEGVGFSVKLPESALEALESPHAQPTGYGLGKAGWVSFDFPPGEEPDDATLQAWVVESWRSLAPKKAVKAYDGR
jgi:predicted DNA-binding protein (MmcQ/YjbR family)